MTLKDRITSDLASSMKAGDKRRTETLRFIKKELLEKETQPKRIGQGELTPEEEIEALMGMVKRRRDSIEQFKQNGRLELAETELEELKIVEAYLPKPLSEEEILEVLKRLITALGATSAKDAGKVTGAAMKELKGKTDGATVQRLIKTLLS